MAENENEVSLITIINENKAGMLSKITGYCGKNNINIEKLVISSFKSDNLLHKIVMFVTGNRARINGLIDGFLSIEGVVSASNFKSSLYIERELMIVKVNSDNESLPKIVEISTKYGGQVIMSNRDVKIFQFALKSETIDDITKKIEELDTDVEISKSGIIATSLHKN